MIDGDGKWREKEKRSGWQQFSGIFSWLNRNYLVMKEFKKENMDHKIELSSPEVLCKSNLL